MIPKITNATNLITKAQPTRLTKAAIVGTGVGALAVLSTRQAWPYCQGLGQPEYTGNPNIETLDPDDPLLEQLKQVGGLRGAMNRMGNMYENMQEKFASLGEHLHDGIEHAGDKAHDTYEQAKDFLTDLLQ